MMGRFSILVIIWMMVANVLADSRKMGNNKMEQTPDFRYPQTVSQNALMAYDEAIKINDYNHALQALIQYALAESSRSDSAMTSVMTMSETLYENCDKPEYRVMVDHLRSRMCMSYATKNWWTQREEYIQKAKEYHKSAKHLADGLSVPARQIGENLLRADEWGWRIIPTLSDYLRQWEYENPQLQEEHIEQWELLKQWRSQQNDLATEMYLEFMLLEMQDGDEQYLALKKYIATYPDSPYQSACRNRIAQMEREEVRIVYNNVSTTRADITVKVSVDNLHDFTLTMYRLPNGVVSGDGRKYSVKELQPVAETLVHIDEVKLPFYRKDAIATFAPQDYGKYIILPSFTDKNGELCSKSEVSLGRWDSPILTVTDLAAYSVSEGNKHYIIPVDRTTGEPQKDVRVDRIEDMFRLTRGADCYSDPESVHEWDHTLPKAETNVHIFTDLKMYRPGETLRGTAVAYCHNAEYRKPLSDKPCIIVLRDADGKEVSTYKGTLDDMGQVTFSMDIPTDRKNGSWRLSCETEGSRDYDGKGYTSVEVSEYKLPTFSVDLSETPTVQQKGAKGVVKGQAMTFTGMPVVDAEVELTLSRHTWWWWRRNDDAFSQKRLIVRTDVQGRFHYDCPAEWFNMNDNDCYIYQAQVSCTNTAGERHDASCSFTVGRADGITLSVGDLLLPADGKIMLPAQYQTSQKDTKPVKCQYRLTEIADTSMVVKQGNVMSNDMCVDWSDVPSGEYLLEASVCGADEKDVARGNVTLYRETDKESPSSEVLWIPEPTQRVSKDGKTTDILIGVKQECYIYYVVESRTKVEKVKSHWLHYKPGMHHLCLPMPKGTDDYLQIQLLTMLDGKQYSENIQVATPRKERLQLVATSFRDKTKPGQSETWSFRLIDQDGKPVKSARLILEAYNKALKQLATNKWYMNAEYLTASLCDLSVKTYGNTYNSICGTLIQQDECNPMLPKLWLYGIDFFGSGRIMKHRVYAAKASPVIMSDSMIANDAVMDSMGESVSAIEEAATDGTDAEADSATGMRTGDLHVALWEPRLTSDKDGNVEVTFTVPEQNATWVVQALAYSKTMTSSKWEGGMLVQRQLMVQPVLPRFVRQGDHVVLKAQVMNASDSAQHAHIVFELYDPRTNASVQSDNAPVQSDNAPVQSESSDCEIPAKSTRVVEIACDVPDDLPYLGVRIKATGVDGCGDGEQQLLPVASNAQPVVETYPFYLQPDVITFEHTLETPNGNRPNRVTLEFCNNPTWYCVQALPSMINEDARTSIDMAHSLFAIVLADHLRADSIVDQTPYGKLISKLQALQKVDGGFAWIDYEGCVSSGWATGEVVELIGELYRLGCLKGDHQLLQMAKLAIVYMERNALKLAERMQKANDKDYSTFMSFAYIRYLFEGVYPVSDTKVQEILDKTILSLTQTWGSFSLADKAFIAMLLNRTGHQDMARNIIESLRQFAVTTSAKGMYWERLNDGFWFHPVAATSIILQAMAEVDPRIPELNKIRQWLLLEKQTSNWGSSSLASDAVYALLSTGDNWLRDMSTEPFAVSVDGNRVEAQVKDKQMGYLKIELADNAHNVQVERTAGTPAWGAIFWEYVAPVTEIREVSLPEISIRKSLLVQDSDGKWIPLSDTLRVGQRVQVRLDVHADKALEYVTITDERPAMFEPVDQTSHYEWNRMDGYFHETKDRQTILYIHRLRAGDHSFTYECDVTHEGTFSSGIATVISNYAPQFTAHTAGAQTVVHP